MISVDHCSWDQPGSAPFRGDVPAAVAHYTDIPPAVRAELRARMERRQFDDVAEIRRDSIVGARTYSNLRSMHFAQTLCRDISRAKWSDTAVERGLVYCVEEHCLIVPTVCNNVSRVSRLPERSVPLAATETPADFAFEPPGAIAPEQPLGTSEVPTLLGTATVPTPIADTPSASSSFSGGSTPPGWPGPFVIVPGAFVPAETTPSPAVPEPATWWTMLAGVSCLALWRMRSRR
jgi:hypothetical protein